MTRTARLEDTKTGASLRPLSRAACAVLRELPNLGALVFPASVGTDRSMRGFHKVWLRVAKRAELPADVTPHIADAVLLKAADAVSEHIEQLMDDPRTSVCPPSAPLRHRGVFA